MLATFSRARGCLPIAADMRRLLITAAGILLAGCATNANAAPSPIPTFFGTFKTTGAVGVSGTVDSGTMFATPFEGLAPVGATSCAAFVENAHGGKSLRFRFGSPASQTHSLLAAVVVADYSGASTYELVKEGFFIDGGAGGTYVATAPGQLQIDETGSGSMTVTGQSKNGSAVTVSVEFRCEMSDPRDRLSGL